ncbi:hypothetical protein Tco_0989876 [Tanacetum coccineum]|uniref:Uncharacterized protein n=1 Tax=Tanacetum coccineum TaxID=301880 RepID=A0ABQ5EWG4_9ASTR
MTESPLMDSSFAIPVFSLRDDPIACLNKAMTFLTAIASSRFPSTYNQLKTSSNPRNQATIQDGKVTVQQVHGRQGQSYSGTRFKSNDTSSRGNNLSRQARVAKRYNCQVLVEAHEAGQILDEEKLAFLADPGVPDGQAGQTIIPNNAAFQTEDPDTYDSDCVLEMQDFEQPPAVNFIDNEIDNDSNIHLYSQYLQETQQANEKANKEQNNESVTAELERYKERVKTFEQRLNIDLSSHEKMIDSQMNDMIREKLALKEQINSLEQNISKQIKEKECLL